MQTHTKAMMSMPLEQLFIWALSINNKQFINKQQVNNILIIM